MAAKKAAHRALNAPVDWVRLRRLGGLLDELSSTLAAGGVLSEADLRRLEAGWGNPGSAASTAYLDLVQRELPEGATAVLECGSGASTLLLALFARRDGFRVYSLEHLPRWRARVVRALDVAGLRSVAVLDAPIGPVDEDTDWYDTTLLPEDVRFQYVVCDGPPSLRTKGARYGLLPKVSGQLDAGAVIVLDDADRVEEQEVLRRWNADFGASTETLVSGGGTFGRAVAGGQG